ncbi:hypothetical protein BO78DRAFT_310700 [Aspergillus sclerotiicarbonarius CBS 121057]|uniref:Multicopper oxidase n=1 Tax=Aspergillus sclerotiicarbonarius (strain CBS 121057 / IBT 28362) TaxID=1448318 RepID=A0A319EDY2_ASPSB|nr:hypothetical protein BO78DRAFT_310700 [Aspergillus sclerotiicarbonarius CBS 121057]
MLLESCFTAIFNFFGFSSLLPFHQQPLPPHGGVAPSDSDDLTFAAIGASITCNYTGLSKYYTGPDTHGNWSVWFESKDESQNKSITIDTDYEHYIPPGIDRHVYVDVGMNETHPKIPDGRNYTQGKYFNNSYPGPYIEACWGDTIHVHVTNSLKHNGTAIHMHGIRLLNDSLADGVPGVSQCPIAPGESFTYKFRAVQYGTTWYHSHYSLQYTDGLLGPLTIHGPASVDSYDEAIYPLLIADHNDRSAFEDWSWATVEGMVQGPINMESITINGNGSYQGRYPDNRYRQKVEPNKRILLRLINASTDSAYIFSIDDHELEIIGADLVPVHPYKKTHLYIGIGQRYHVILQTKPEDSHEPSYWIRTEPAQQCENFACEPNERQGILLYDENVTHDPTTGKQVYDSMCQDEDHTDVKPVTKWNVPRPTPQQLNKAKLPYKVMREDLTLPPESEGNIPAGPDISAWKIMDDPAWVKYTDPTVNHTDISEGDWPANAALFEVNRTASGGWAYMLIDGGHQTEEKPKKPGGSVIPAAHPIHLHGHDFALLKQSYEPFDHSLIGNDTAMEGFIDTFVRDNPARRDVVLLPRDGYIVIAFKVDNPGAWLLHCHIAWHASGGLALQILEDKDQLSRGIHGGRAQVAFKQLQDGCDSWKTWYNDWSNHHNTTGRFQDDSGV